MEKKRIGSLALATLIVTGMTGGYAFAKEHGDEAQNAQALLNSKISLSQAITTAEQQSGGKAIGAGVDNEKGTLRIAVEVANNQGVKTVLVDPQTGQVTGTKTDDDHDEEEHN
jgi:uncharacterized membrane protein YkoI